MNDVVSIITPNFNRANLVLETAESILSQTYPHWEWMIVDDGSTDNSWEVLESLAKRDSRIKIHKRDRGPKGACVCRNIAIERCTGKYLIFLDTDDVLAPFCLEQRINAMHQQPDMDFIIFPLLLFRKQIDDTNLLWNVEKDKDELMRMLINDPVCQGTGTLWKKSKFVEIGLWREDLKIWQDVELHIRSFLWPVKHAKRMDLPPDVYLRMSDDSLSRVGYYSKEKVASRLEVFRYTCKTLLEKNMMEQYRVGIRTMGYEIITGAVFKRNFKAATIAIGIAAEFGIYNKIEVSLFRRLVLIHRFKLNKLKWLEEKFFTKVRKITPDGKDTVGIIPYRDTALQPASGNLGNGLSALNMAG